VVSPPVRADDEWHHWYDACAAPKSTSGGQSKAVTSEVKRQSTSSAIKAEYQRLLTIRRDDLVAVAGNAGLVTICWFLLPDTALNWLFALHGALAFAYVLEMWMLADTPATNVFGRDPDRALPLLRDPAAMRQWLRAKHIALWTFVGPPCAVVALVIGIARGQYSQAVAVALLLLSLPLGVLSVAAWIGIWLPYHPRELLWRWRHRSDWRGAVLRWGILVLLPFLVVPVIAVLLLTPTLLIWTLAAQPEPMRDVGPAGLWIGTAVACPVSLIVFAVGPVVTAKIASRRLDTLSGYLGNPEHG
jgi:hypothetical protein